MGDIAYAVGNILLAGTLSRSGDIVRVDFENADDAQTLFDALEDAAAYAVQQNEKRQVVIDIDRAVDAVMTALENQTMPLNEQK